jgi:hypothetical protein
LIAYWFNISSSARFVDFSHFSSLFFHGFVRQLDSPALSQGERESVGKAASIFATVNGNVLN